METLRERLTVMLRSRPLLGDNGLTLPISDVYYIQVHLSFRGSWPRVTPRATKPDCGPNITGTGTKSTSAGGARCEGESSQARSEAKGMYECSPG